jgi:type IV pilus assembly protein PilO
MAGLDLENKPWWVALILGLVLAGALYYALDAYVFKQMRLDIESASQELETLQQKVREGKAAEGRLAQFREESERLNVELQRLLRILPTERQTDELIKRIKSLAERGGFRFATFQPQAFVKQDFYTEWPINVQLQGTYHELALFFDRLAKFSRIINVDSMAISAVVQGQYSINSNFTIKTFIYGEVKDQPGGQS